MSNLISTSNGMVFAPGLKERQQIQRARVSDGIRDGTLTGNELKVLREMRQDYRVELADAKGDNGWVGPRERRALHQGQTIYALGAFSLCHWRGTRPPLGVTSCSLHLN